MGESTGKSNGQAIQKGLTGKNFSEATALEGAKLDSRVSETNESESGLEQQYEQLDKTVRERLEIRYSEWIPPEKVAAERQKLTEIQGKQEYQRELAERFPYLRPEEREAIVGYVDDTGAHLERNIQTPATLVHERLHGFSHPEAKRVLGNHLYEGLTEELASREADLYLKLKDVPECYPENRETLNLIKARVPESALLQAYFLGNDSRLQAFIDHDLGEGTWENVKELLERADRGSRDALEEARQILKQDR